jgi:hypothetical protein
MIGRIFGHGNNDTYTEADYDTISIPADTSLDELYGEGRRGNEYQIRPDTDHDGIGDALRLHQGLHDARSSGGENTSTSFVFEIRRVGGRVSFHCLPGNSSKTDSLLTQLETAYPGSEVSEQPLTTLQPHDESDGEVRHDGERHVAASKLELSHEAVRPVRHVDIEGFDADPYNSVIQAMSPGEGPRTAGGATDMIIQIVIRPCLPNWTDGPPGERSITEVAEELAAEKTEKRDGELISWTTYEVEVEASEKEKKAAQILRDLANEDGWSLNIRIATAADTPEEARDRTHNVGRMFRAYYESATGQGFEPIPCTTKTIDDVLDGLVNRRFDEEGIWVSRHELAGLAHLPNDDVGLSSIDRSYGSVKRGVPVGTPRFDYRRSEIDPTTATPAEKQVTMCADCTRDSPLWYGWGTKHSVEAGVFSSLLDTHQFVGGSTGRGKTTLLKNFWRQVISRGFGSLFIDPKGRDAGEFVDLIPEARRDDFVYIEIGGNRGREVGFNFLEPSGDVEHGTAAYVDAVEACAEDLAGTLAEAGDGEHGDAGWGTRMDRITKNVVRGMARAPEPLTILDMHYALGSQEQRQQYASMLADEQINWIQDYAENHLADMDDDALEPLAGRLQQLVENDIVRNMISVRESTISIEEILREGKIIVLNNKTTSSTAKRLITTALIRRIWVAVREQSYSSGEDPPPFFPIIDEFDSVVSERSRIHSILSEARAFGLCLTLACQNPSSQLPDRIDNAIQNQCETFLSFNPGGPSDARLIAKQHSRDIDDEDLLDLPKYRILLRTHTDTGELTPSYPVNAFPPLEESAADAGLGEKISAISEAEREERIQHSLEQYGAPRRTDAEIQRESRFYTGPIDDDSPDPVSDDEKDSLYKAVYDAQIVHSDTPLNPTPIPFETLAAAIRTALGSAGDCDTTLHDGQVEAAKDRLCREHLHETDDYTYSVGPDGLAFLDQGDSPTAGKKEHRRGVTHAYHHLTHHLPECTVAIPDQGGSSDLPDLTIADPLEIRGSGLAARKQRQQFEADHPIRAVLTSGTDTAVEFEYTTKHKDDSLRGKVQRAYEADQACLFVVWSESDARTVHRHLTTSDAHNQLPDGAVWNVLIVPSGESSFDVPQLSLAPPHSDADADLTLLSLPDVSPEAVDDALSSASEPVSSDDLFDF